MAHALGYASTDTIMIQYPQLPGIPKEVLIQNPV